MERIFVANIRYGKIAINPDGIKRILVEKAKNKAYTFTVQIKYSNYHSVSRCRTLNNPINNAKEMYLLLEDIFDDLYDVDSPIRLVGVSASKLITYNDEIYQISIFDNLDEDEKKILHSVYSEDINIEELYEYTSAQIQNLEPIEGSINDKYIIKCDKIVGITIDKQPTDTIKVIVIPNTKDIITMYPIPTINNKLEIENNYTSSKQKVRESQIDKFNRRYAKNS